MTPRELLDEILSQGPRSDALALECRLIFRILRDNVQLVELADGAGLHDASDFIQLFRELVDELTPATCARKGPETLRQEQPRDWNETS